MTIARLDGEVIAESNDTIIVEGKYYFPPHAVHTGFLRPTEAREDGYHYSVVVHGRTMADCACCARQVNIPDPRVAKHVTFNAPVEIVE